MAPRPRATSTAPVEPKKNLPPRPPKGQFSTNPALTPRKAWTVAEAREQMKLVEQMHLQGWSIAQMLEAVHEHAERHPTLTAFPFGKARLITLKNRVEQNWKTEDDQRRPTWKSAAIRRIERRIRLLDAKLQSLPNADAGTKIHGALQGWEQRLARIQGTEEAMKIDVDVRVSQSIAGVIMNLTPDQVADMLERAQERDRLADQARHQLGEGSR